MVTRSNLLFFVVQQTNVVLFERISYTTTIEATAQHRSVLTRFPILFIQRLLRSNCEWRRDFFKAAARFVRVQRFIWLIWLIDYIGFIGLNGDLNQAITIRTFVSRGNVLYYQAGGGIVAKSDVERELQEVNNKLGALKRAILLAESLKN